MKTMWVKSISEVVFHHQLAFAQATDRL